MGPNRLTDLGQRLIKLQLFHGIDEYPTKRIDLNFFFYIKYSYVFNLHHVESGKNYFLTK